jgi:hypothetical protein
LVWLFFETSIQKLELLELFACSSILDSIVEPYEDALVSVLASLDPGNFEDKPYMRFLYCTDLRKLASNIGYHYLENK